MEHRNWTIIAVVVAAGLASCDGDEPRLVAEADAPQQVSATYCEQMFACSCDGGRRFATEQECLQNTTELLTNMRAMAQAAGLTYEPACLGAYLDDIEDRGCAPEAPSSETCSPPCNPYHGTAGVGMPCSWLGQGVSECAQGLVCNGECVDPCGEVQDAAQVGQSCDRRPCALDLVCDFETRTCKAAPTPGEPCPEGQCAEGAFCDQVDPMDPSIRECVALGGNGDACSGHVQCKTGYCPAGRCDDLPTEGESCAGTFACASGLECRDDICVPADAVACRAAVPYGGY